MSVQTILLVADATPAPGSDAATRLREEGYQVVVADSGERALAIARRSDPRIDAVVVDLGAISGTEIAERIRGERGLPIILLSSIPDPLPGAQAVGRHGVEAGVTNLAGLAAAIQAAPPSRSALRRERVGPWLGRILVMDDEIRVREAVARLLALLGWDAETAADGDVAVEKYRQAMVEGHRFDLVILDLSVREGMGGGVAIQRLLGIDPAVVAVVSSGYLDDEIVTNPEAHGFRGALTKPYSRATLEALLQRVIQRHDTATARAEG